MRATPRWCSTMLLIFAVFGAGSVNAQVLDSSLTIRVESRRVLVPVTLSGAVSCDQDDHRDQYLCSWDGEEIKVAYNKVALPIRPVDLGFAAIKNLRLFEDGKEQKIESIETINSADSGVRHDNLGAHREWGNVPEGFWSTSDQDSRLFDGALPGSNLFVRSFPSRYYQISYIPPSSPEGNCHGIHLKLGRHESRLVYRHEYCNVSHSSSDPLRGTSDDARLRQLIEISKGGGSIHPHATANYFYDLPGKTRVHIELEFPFDEVKAKKWSDFNLSLDVLIVASRSENIGARRSDYWWYPDGNGSGEMWDTVGRATATYTPTRYDAQMELQPNDYELAIAVSHGPKKFGTIEVPLTINSYDGKQLGISSIALCKRVRKAGNKPVAAEFVPLVSNGYEFTPAADAVFHKGESPMVYLELYEPKATAPNPTSMVAAQPGQPSVQFQMRIVNATTGAVEMKTEMSAAQWMQPGESTIPIGLKPELDKLAPGKYRLEIQASDSVGGNTPWRAAEFSIE